MYLIRITPRYAVGNLMKFGYYAQPPLVVRPKPNSHALLRAVSLDRVEDIWMSEYLFRFLFNLCVIWFRIQPKNVTILASWCICVLMGCSLSESVDNQATTKLISQSVNVGPFDNQSQNESISFALANGSARDVIVRGVSASCGCMDIGIEPGIRIAAGDVFNFTVRVTIPDMGTKYGSIVVTIDSGQSLRSDIVIRGRQELPQIVTGGNNNLSFHELVDTTTSRVVEVQTLEKVGEPRWVDRLTVDHPDVLVSEISTMDRPVSVGQLQRTYKFEVRFERLPTVSEFGGPILILVNSGAQRQIRIGQSPDRCTIQILLYLKQSDCQFLVDEAPR